jgi:hypothetical protein
LPYPGETPDWEKKYERFFEDWGTHFTTGITLGGLAYQRTSGLATTYLRSTESERTLQTKAGAQLEAAKANASAEAAQTISRKTDQEYSLDRGKLDFRGGLGDPTAIDRAWVESLVDRPAIVKAKLERLSYLLTPRFFPDQDFIDELQKVLDTAITNWIVAKGRPTGDTAPLRYGEAVVMIRPWQDGKTEHIGGLRTPGSPLIEFPLRNGKPFYPETMKAALRILSGDGSNKNTVILAGDQVRFELIDVGFLNRDLGMTRNPSEAGRFTILHQDDNIRAPGRIGEYFQSSDRVAFLPAGATDRCFGISTASQRLEIGPIVGSGAPAFRLRRCAEREED